MRKQFIGVSLGNNTSAALISAENGVEFAISEERLVGEKNTKKFPINAIIECIKRLDSKGNPSEVNIGISSYEVINNRTYKYIDGDSVDVDPVELENYFPTFYDFMRFYIRMSAGLSLNTTINITRVDHHEAHMLPTAYMSGFKMSDQTLVTVTADGFGDGVSATITNHDTGEVIAREHIQNSIGLIYQYVTGALGYKEHQHEGKITGLAALGKPLYTIFFEEYLVKHKDGELGFSTMYKQPEGTTAPRPLNNNIYGFNNMMDLRESVYKLIHSLKDTMDADDKDIAASVQAYTEKMLTSWVKSNLEANNIKDFNIALSGGVFANVKVNYEIKDKVKPENLFVLPPMGDEGTAIGAAISIAEKTVGKGSLSLEAFAKDDLYLGKISGKRVEADLSDLEGFDVIKGDEMVNTVAHLIANEKIVCVSKGFSEFGPRALGNHSILFDASKKETNDYLNKRLNRTEFMPFAPITLDKFYKDLFLNTAGLKKTLKYMTIAVPVTREFEEGYKAAYHVDKTARPQVLSEEDNPVTYAIIQKYHELTGKKALINTSFNLHNHPIILDEYTALASFMEADLDALLLDDKLIVKAGIL